MFSTEHAFTLPLGFLDADGTLHREGTMRLATAADEIEPLRDPRVQRNPAFLTVILLSRVVTALGSLEVVTPKTIEALFAADLEYLQRLYNEANRLDGHEVVCPACAHVFVPEDERLGGILAYPADRMMEELAFVAYHFHWRHDDVAALEHADRRAWVGRISEINERMVGE